MIITLIFLNLFIAIIVDGYSDTSERNMKMFNTEFKEEFRDAWCLFDYDASSFIHKDQFP